MLPGSAVDVRPRCYLCGIVCRKGGRCPTFEQSGSYVMCPLPQPYDPKEHRDPAL
jgi:hypothetical protein